MPIRVIALIAWMEFRIHRIKPVWMKGCSRPRWIPCDFYGRALADRKEGDA